MVPYFSIFLLQNQKQISIIIENHNLPVTPGYFLVSQKNQKNVLVLHLFFQKQEIFLNDKV